MPGLLCLLVSGSAACRWCVRAVEEWWRDAVRMIFVYSRVCVSAARPEPGRTVPEGEQEPHHLLHVAVTRPRRRVRARASSRPQAASSPAIPPPAIIPPYCRFSPAPDASFLPPAAHRSGPAGGSAELSGADAAAVLQELRRGVLRDPSGRRRRRWGGARGLSEGGREGGRVGRSRESSFSRKQGACRGSPPAISFTATRVIMRARSTGRTVRGAREKSFLCVR